MRHPAPWIALPPGVFVAVLAVVLATQVGTDPRDDTNRSHLVGKNAPAFDLPILDRNQVRSNELRGTVVVINFWNSWCIPCQQEHGTLSEFYRRHAGDSSFAMIGIVRDDTESAVRGYVQDEGVPYTVAFDPGGRAALDYGTRGQPETYAITTDGVIAASNFGPSSVAQLETMYRAARGRQ